MIGDPAVDVALMIVAWVLGWLQRNSRAQRKWRLVRELAQRELDSPRGTNDPVVAVEHASVQVHRDRIRSESQKLPTSSARTPRRESENGNPH